MSSLRYFLEKGEKDYAPLFQGLKIMETGEKYSSYMGKYLMVSVSLKSETRSARARKAKQSIWRWQFPNSEVRYVYKNAVLRWFEEKTERKSCHPCMRAFQGVENLSGVGKRNVMKRSSRLKSRSMKKRSGRKGIRIF